MSLLRTLRRPFLPIELKVALAYLDEAEMLLGSDSSEILLSVNEQIFNLSIEFMKAESPTEIRAMVYNEIATTAEFFVTSGYYHIYRGTLNLNGISILRAFEGAVNEIKKCGALKEKEASNWQTEVRKKIEKWG
ncbi:hypothetical protein COU80_05440 [Candidatus Peregrinibacteria bacterium CG10_big_fil_rev_8_21_14_0_10_55_24]|nr:MAG: hypothetical protein COU80_05440 [Candidatus Peregrinibacteria bacterium CG10_big_fil_rev_8_21_14_0_10_55_24]